MKPLAEQTHYEVLEVDRSATPEEIEGSYGIAQATYGQASMATYSVFCAEDVELLQQRVESAYAVLSDAAARRDYDATLGGDDSGDASRLPAALASPESPLGGELPPAAEGFGEFEEDPDSGVYDGARLRRARLARAIEIQQISSTTKISSTYLRFIEEERFDDLPAPVYVRGFVAAYARCLGLDAQRVAASYMERFRQRQSEAERASHRGRS